MNASVSTQAGTTERRLIVGISGASGFVYGQRLLELLRPLDVEVHLVVSRAAKLTMARESTLKLAELHALADQGHGNDDVRACIPRGSHRALGMGIAPCSMTTQAEIATGNTASLMSRAAEVTLKERRRLVLLARETPLTLTQLRNMVALTEMGAIVAPPVPAFYARPASLAEMVDHTLGRVLDLFELDVGTAYRWAGMAAERRTADPD